MRIVRREVSPEALAALPDDLHPLLKRIYAARKVMASRELEKTLNRLQPPGELRGMAAAVALLEEAIRRQRRILIVGDFDADGATSSALGVRALKALGAGEVGYLVPNRFEYGYGLTPEIVQVAARREPWLLVTVDNGISSLQGVRAAREKGMRVLVTDHHLPGRELPDADAIVNPNQPQCGFGSKCIAGVGVIFYVMTALRAKLREGNWFEERGIPVPNMAAFLDLVALGTVADVVPLDHTNRILVEQGLKRIRAGQASAGVLALAQVAGVDSRRITATDIGFRLGPRLNAAGRLEDMSFGIETLLCDDLQEARKRAAQLDRLNRERQAIEEEMRQQALADLERLELDKQSLPFGLCLYDEGWHQGVIGILAARIREQTHRPTIAFAPDKDGMIKGSARSVPGLHIRDALDAVAAKHPGLVMKFGGHAMAAGLSLEGARFGEFQVAFDREVRRWLGEEDICEIIHSDGNLSPPELCLETAEVLREAGPWGQGYPEPTFDGVF
ncbi:MAG: single-stranded-DNA-specific exonuclease RecJ, partial [Candidatus Competibacteraceae bacterium]|nr:single-stranded-DNA-specific exonuclease RecJ [Candidatus Competibacteraceae bacterium]